MKKNGIKGMLLAIVALTLVFTLQGTGSAYAVSLSKIEKMAASRLKKLDATEQSTKNLKKAFKWSANLKYQDNTKANLKGDKAAKYYGNYGFERHYGDCNTVAYTFYFMAKALGYDAKIVQGYVKSSSGAYRTHAWVTIKTGGKKLVFDPDFNRTMRGKTVTSASGTKKLGTYCGFKFSYGDPFTYKYCNSKKKELKK